MTKGNEKDETLFSHMTLKPMTPEQLFDSLLTATAAHKAGTATPTNRQARCLAQAVHLRLRQRRGRGGVELPGDDPPGPDDDERRADGAGRRRQAGQLPGRPARSRPSAVAPVAGVYMVNHIYLAALSRYPTPRELASGRAVPHDSTPTRSRPGRRVLGPAELERVHPEPLGSPGDRPRHSPRGSAGCRGFRPMSDRLIVPRRDVPPPLPGPPGDDRAGVPAMQFFSSLEANAQQLRKTQQELHPALDVGRAEPHGYLGPEARQREERRPVQADRRPRPAACRSASICPTSPSRCTT